MSSKRHSGSDEDRTPSPRVRDEQSFRPRASTMPSDVMRRLQEGKKKHREEKINHRRQAWVVSDKSDTGNGNGSNHFHLNSHTLSHHRQRAQTMPSEGMPRPRRPASSRDAPPTNLRVAALTNSCRDRSNSLDTLTRSKSVRNSSTNNHIRGDRSPNGTAAADWSSEEHLEEYFNQCLSRFSDESLAVQREPLPKGSDIFEQVLGQLEHEKLDLTTVQKSKPQKKVRRKSQPARTCHHPVDSPKGGRRVHWNATCSAAAGK